MTTGSPATLTLPAQAIPRGSWANVRLSVVETILAVERLRRMSHLCSTCVCGRLLPAGESSGRPNGTEWVRRCWCFEQELAATLPVPSLKEITSAIIIEL